HGFMPYGGLQRLKSPGINQSYHQLNQVYDSHHAPLLNNRGTEIGLACLYDINAHAGQPHLNLLEMFLRKLFIEELPGAKHAHYSGV
ncbi:MAG: hypothetical protein Q8O57_12495, partial [Kiritimatiellota bacterium]|nr:hypothetical protein [Kiritimatiellota bacterium]